MQNIEIAKVLNQYADLLDIKDESPFRVRSYRQAARTIDGLSRPVAELLEDKKKLRKLPGIGSRMVEHLEEIVETGTLAALEQVHKELPASLSELVELEGLGPKRAKQLYDSLGIASLEDLEKALDQNKLVDLPGIGKKTADKLRDAIRRSGQYGRFKLSEADQLVRPILEYLRGSPGIKEMEVAGSYRRRKETIGDADILAACTRPEDLMERFQKYPEASRVEMAGKTRGTIALRSGLQVDLRIVALRSYGAALLYFTGSKDHNIAVRKLALERRLHINEYGVFRIPKGKRAEDLRKEEGRRVAGRTEEEVYKTVGMAWVPPELREDRGEVKAARKGKLPRLIRVDDIRGDLHMHSKWTDGGNTIEEMANACRDRGYEYCAITDHSKETRVAGGLNAKQFRRQFREIEKVRGRLGGMVLLSGVEVDILADGSLDLPADLLAEFDVVVAAVHSKLNMKRKEMTERIVTALQNRAVDILAHPTAKQINKREAFEVDLERILHVAKEHGVAVELNAQPERLDLSDIHVYRAKELGINVVISTDAHTTGQLRFVECGIDQARRGWLEKRHVVNTMTWGKLQAWLNRRRR